MSEESTPGAEPRKNPLFALLPEKEGVTTSLGLLFVRHLTANDLSFLEAEEDLGEAVLKVLVGRNSEKTDQGGLSDDDFAALTEADVALLAPVVVDKSEWPPLEGAPTLDALRAVARAGIDAHKQQRAKLFETIRRKVERDYSFLGQGALDRLKDQVSGLAALRGGLGSSMQDALRAAESPSQRLLRMAEGSPSEQLRRMAGGSASEQLRQQIEHSSDDPTEAWASPHSKLNIESLKIPSLEELPIGRATLKMAEQTSLLAAKMDALLEVVGGLNQTLVTDVLPAWFNQVAADQAHAKATLKQAANGLRWTKWAVIASVVATVVTATWQVQVAKEVDRSTGAVLASTEALLKEQLSLQQSIIEQQARDAEALRKVISALQARPGAGDALRGSGK